MNAAYEGNGRDTIQSPKRGSLFFPGRVFAGIAGLAGKLRDVRSSMCCQPFQVLFFSLYSLSFFLELPEFIVFFHNIPCSLFIRAFTQEDLALKIGVPSQTIIAIEKDRYVPSLSLAFRVARLFGVPGEEVFLNEEIIQPLPDNG